MMPHSLSNEQIVMERRFNLPYNWCKGDHTRYIRQKSGIWDIAQKLSDSLREKHVLDAGCGDGWYTEKMLRAGARPSGIDYSERGIRHARAIVEGVDFQVASITEIPFENGLFDISFSFQVIEHLPPVEVSKAVSELVRVTKPGGLVIVSVPSKRRRMSHAHYQHFNESMLRELFEPYADEIEVLGQDRRTRFLWIIERLIQNRFYTLESVGRWFNRTVYLSRYNRCAPDVGDNLVVRARINS